jgi:hypothetical protein
MLPLEKALFAGPSKDRDFNIVARHYGFDGRGGANFQRTGDEFGLTRERVRQIVSEADPHTHLLPKGATALDRATSFIGSNLPAPAASLETRLQQAGLTSKPFRLEGIVSAARLLSRTLPFRISSLGKTRYVVPALYPEFGDIAGEARQRVRKHGMVNIEEFLQSSAESNEAGRETGVLEAVLSYERDFRWLDKRTGWFWLSETPRNCAVSRIRKMLAVANPLPLGEMRAGLARMGSPLAPESTLLEFCRQIEGIIVRGNSISASPEIPATEVLNKTEWDLFQLLSENNGCMSNSDLICQSSVLGIKRPTFYQCVTYSPIVARFNGNHYRLIGASAPDSGAVISPETAGNALRA